MNDNSSPVKKAATTLGGVLLILLGIVLLVLPGPGMFCILLGVLCVGEAMGKSPKKKLLARLEQLKAKEEKQGSTKWAPLFDLLEKMSHKRNEGAQ